MSVAGMTEAEIIESVAGLPGVVVLTAGEENGAPESAWGDTFFFHDPDGDTPADRRMPFATIVVSDYPGFDESSRLNRPGVFRLNIAVGRDGFRELIGHSPAEHDLSVLDFSVLDEVLPHPAYAVQGWISILNPGEKTAGQAETLLRQAHARAAARRRR
jgi:hypothetical protein